MQAWTLEETVVATENEHLFVGSLWRVGGLRVLLISDVRRFNDKLIFGSKRKSLFGKLFRRQ
jgi:hypothetical protein